MKRTFSFRGQLDVGAMGVTLAKTVLRSRFPNITDLQADMEQQKRGVDLYVEGLGYLEVKTDSHRPRNFFLELSVSGKPGAVDRSTADWFCILFFKHKVLYLIPRSNLQMWLRENYAWILQEHPEWIKRTRSREGKSIWLAEGVIIPRELLIEDMDIGIIEWNEEDEIVE